MTDYYKILNVPQNATDDQIKTAFKRMAMVHHPDRNQNTKKSEDQFKLINEAYSILSDSVKRLNYNNTYYKAPFNNTGIKKENVFKDIFGNQMKEPKTQIFIVNISFWDAIKGGNKIYTFNVNTISGIKKATANINLPRLINQDDIFEVSFENSFFNIKMNILPDSNFKRDNLDLYSSADIPVTTAILGGQIKFSYLDKDLNIKIPAGIKNNQTLRISNAGLKKEIFVGDLYIKCNVAMPEAITAKQKDLLTEFNTIEESKEKSLFSKLKNGWHHLFEKH